MKFHVMTPEEEEAQYATKFPEQYAAEKRREEFDKKHPRCDACGQFLKKRPPVTNPLALELGVRADQGWVTHYVQDYWGEWDHV